MARFLKAETRSRRAEYWERTKEREREGGRDADAGAGWRSRKYWIHAAPTYNAARAIFGRFPFHAVASRASKARTTGRYEEYKVLE